MSADAAVKRIGPRVAIVAGTSMPDAGRIRDPEREVREVKRADAILLAASSFFTRELDPRLPW